GARSPTLLGELKKSSGFARAIALEDLTPAQRHRVQLHQGLLNLLRMLSTPWPSSQIVLISSVCVPNISRIGSLLVSKIPGRGSLPSTPKECSTRSSRPNQMALGWVFLSAAR